MTRKRPVKLKVEGLDRDVEDMIRELEQYFTLTRTSTTIPHREDDESHAYVLILPEAA